MLQLSTMLVFYCNFLQEKYVQSWKLLNVPRTRCKHDVVQQYKMQDYVCDGLHHVTKK